MSIDEVKSSHGERKFFSNLIISTLGFFSVGVFSGAALTLLILKVHFSAALLLIFLEYLGILITLRSDNVASRYLLGLIGERKVSIILDQMWHDGVRSVSSIELTKQGDIDHVAVAPSGVWVIESKFIGGDISYRDGFLTRNGKPFKKNPLKQAFAEAEAVRKFLSSKGIRVNVNPVLAFSDKFARVRFGINKVEGVHVIGPLGFRHLILDASLPVALPPHAVKQIAELLRAVSHGS